jgi:hypothetical protein
LRSEQEIKKGGVALDDAATVASTLIERRVGDRFSSIYLLGAIVANAKGDSRLARDRLNAYRSGNPGDNKADELARYFLPPPQLTLAAGGESQKSHLRLIQPGIGIASGNVIGTVCCVVRKYADADTKYILCAVTLAAGDSKIRYLGAPEVGGDNFEQIATVTTYLPLHFPSREDPQPSANRVAGTLARILDPSRVDPKCVGVGAFKGTADAVPGEEVRLVGRTTGITTGTVDAVGVSGVAINFGTVSAPVIATFDGVVLCHGNDGRPFSDAGDSGAPVVNVNNQLIGMAFGGFEDMTVVLPIAPILQTLGIQLL